MFDEGLQEQERVPEVIQQPQRQRALEAVLAQIQTCIEIQSPHLHRRIQLFAQGCDPCQVVVIAPGVVHRYDAGAEAFEKERKIAVCAPEVKDSFAANQLEKVKL